MDIPIGLTGETGPSGTDGAYIIADIIVNQASTTTGSFETLYTYTLSNPSPLTEAGDGLIIQAFWSHNAAVAASRPIRIQFGGNTITGITYGMIGGSYLNQSTVRLTRVTTTTASSNTQELMVGSLGNIMGHSFYHLPNKLNTAYQTVPDLGSGAHAIIFQVNSTVVGDCTLDRVIIGKLEKV